MSAQPTAQAGRIVPPGSCDCHVHVFAPAHSRYPVTPGLRYAPPPATLDRLLSLHAALGFERAVITQTTAYSDHQLLIDLLNILPADRYRAIALVDDNTTDAEIQAMHEAGVRGTRFNLVPGFPAQPDIGQIRRTLDRVREYGWIARFHFTHQTLLDFRDLLLSVTGPAILDHMGRPDPKAGIDQPATAFALNLLRERANWWVQLSFGDAMGVAPWPAAVPFGRAFYQAAPQRAIWASDWPHIGMITNRPPIPTPDTVDTLALLQSYLPDARAWHAVLAENPARLFGFPVPDSPGA